MPVLVAIQGGCIGGAVDMTSACDIRYATADAFFCIQEINIGMTADVGTFPRLCKLIPEGWVRELAYTGRRLPAQRAKEIGLVNEVYATHEELLERVLETAREIASKAPLAVAGSKVMINYARDHSIADGLDYIATWQVGMFAPAHMQEAFKARQEKREADFPDLIPASPRHVMRSAELRPPDLRPVKLGPPPYRLPVGAHGEGPPGADRRIAGPRRSGRSARSGRRRPPEGRVWRRSGRTRVSIARISLAPRRSAPRRFGTAQIGVRQIGALKLDPRKVHTEKDAAGAHAGRSVCAWRAGLWNGNRSPGRVRAPRPGPRFCTSFRARPGRRPRS